MSVLLQTLRSTLQAYSMNIETRITKAATHGSAWAHLKGELKTEGFSPDLASYFVDTFTMKEYRGQVSADMAVSLYKDWKEHKNNEKTLEKLKQAPKELERELSEFNMTKLINNIHTPDS